MTPLTQSIDFILKNYQPGQQKLKMYESTLINKWLYYEYDDAIDGHISIAGQIEKLFPTIWCNYLRHLDDLQDKRVEENITVEQAKETEEYYTKGIAKQKEQNESTEKLVKEFFDKKDEDYKRSNAHQVRISEAMIDIAYNAGHHGFTTGNSREDVQLFKQWAYDFYMSWDYDDPNADYIEGIDNYYTQMAGRWALDTLKYALHENEDTW